MTKEQIAALIKRRRLQLLVHSCIYYGMDFNLIDDHTFDKWSDELVQLQTQYPDISKQVEWYDAFKDWDGSTGAFLPLNDPCVISKAKYLLSIQGR